MSRYDKFDDTMERVPVQYGGLSKRPRRCKDLGSIGSLMREPFWREHYFRIEEYEIGAGRFFYERRWKGDRNGKIDPNGSIWLFKIYTTYARLPDEIKKKIESKKEKEYK